MRRCAPLTETQRTPASDWQQDKPQRRSAFLSSTLGAPAWKNWWCSSYSPSDFLVLLATRRALALPEVPEAKLDLMKKGGKEKAMSAVTR